MKIYIAILITLRDIPPSHLRGIDSDYLQVVRKEREQSFYTTRETSCHSCLFSEREASMRAPLKFTAYEWLKEEKSASDEELLAALNKNGNKCSVNELNKVLLHLEILGLVSIRWIAKEKRRIEVVEKPTEDPLKSRAS